MRSSCWSLPLHTRCFQGSRVACSVQLPQVNLNTSPVHKTSSEETYSTASSLHCFPLQDGIWLKMITDLHGNNLHRNGEQAAFLWCYQTSSIVRLQAEYMGKGSTSPFRRKQQLLVFYSSTEPLPPRASSSKRGQLNSEVRQPRGKQGPCLQQCI